MAPKATTNSTGFPLPTGQGFGGDEFSNNLFSDLAPLLTLFGEQVTKQFLSMSMGWADDILLAMGPLGIITVIVSAIRVGGIKMLKAFVGRARESRATAEKEILSSTSNDVCEMWSGREIVRELGSPEGMKDIILLEKAEYFNEPRLTEPTRVLDINTAVARGVLLNTTAETDEIADITNGAPNIALNVHNSTASPKELVIWAIISILLQFSALAFPAITTYYLGWKKAGLRVPAYGYPCFAIGTIAIVIGMIFCGRVIEGSTTEHDFELQIPKQSVKIMRLQKACTVSDQRFSSYAIFNSSNDTRIRTSRRNEKSYSRLAAFATSTAVVGFLCQFVGLRALHWSATIYQLGIMLIMTVVRSLVRRGLAADPLFYPLLDGHELAWLTFHIIWKDEKAAEENGEKLHSNQQRVVRLRQSFDPLTPREQPDPTIDFNLRIHLKKRLQRIISGEASDKEHENTLEQQMLKHIMRWEPLTGYQTIEFTRQSFRDIHGGPRCPAPIRHVLEVEDARLHRVFFPISEVVALIDDDILPADMDTLLICRDLQRLMPTSNDASGAAASLVTAIVNTLNFLATTEFISWHGDHPFDDSKQTRQFQFNIPLLHGRYGSVHEAQIQRMTFTAKGYYESERETMTWSTDKDVLTTFISLWLFSLELRRNTADKVALAMRKLQPQLTIQDLDSFISEELVEHRNIYSRVVGAVTTGVDTIKPLDSQTLIELKCWLDHRISAVISPLTIYEPGPLTRSTSGSEYVGEDPINPWVVWGLLSSSLSNLDNDNSVRSNTTGSTQMPMPQEHIAIPASQENTSSAVIEQSEQQSLPKLVCDFTIRTRPDTTIANHCALEIFSYFIFAIAAQVKEIGGRTSIRGFPSRGEPIEGNRLKNTVLSTIANECVGAGLAHDLDEAYTVIIPAFLNRGLLPKEVHEEIVFPRGPASHWRI